MRAALLLLGLLAGPQRSDLPANDPSRCPYTGGDPELLAAAGIRSLGGFEFGTTDTAGVDRMLSTVEIRWVETDHFELGFGLSRPYAIKQSERDGVRAELEELAQVWPAVNPKTRRLDPWLRAYLHARRLEQVYARFLELVRVDPSLFPDGSGTWQVGTPYYGEGPNLGQKGKFEVLVLPNESASVTFLRESFGLTIRETQRWNVVDRDTLIVVTHVGQEGLREDLALRGHLAYNVAINLLDGFEHYSYETPVWLRVGLGHLIEREINPRYNTFDFSEGGGGVRSKKWKWEVEVKKLVRSGEAARVAQLARKKTYAELSLEDHYVAWSMTDYMTRVRPEGWACLQEALHGRKDAQGFPDGSRLDDVQREAFKECLGLAYAEFDRAWSEWVLETYSSPQR